MGGLDGGSWGGFWAILATSWKACHAHTVVEIGYFASSLYNIFIGSVRYTQCLLVYLTRLSSVRLTDLLSGFSPFSTRLMNIPVFLDGIYRGLFGFFFGPFFFEENRPKILNPDPKKTKFDLI